MTFSFCNIHWDLSWAVLRMRDEAILSTAPIIVPLAQSADYGCFQE